MPILNCVKFYAVRKKALGTNVAAPFQIFDKFETMAAVSKRSKRIFINSARNFLSWNLI